MYYSVFQFQYFFADDYSEIFGISDFDNFIEHLKWDISKSGRPMHAIEQYLISIYVSSKYYSYYVLRFLQLVQIYVLSLLILHTFNKAINNRFTSMLLTIFIFSTPIFSVNILWLVISIPVTSYIITIASTLIFIKLYTSSNNYFIKMVTTIIFTAVIAMSELFYQISATVPIAIIVIFLLFNENILIYNANVENKSFNIGQIIYKYQLVFTTIFAVLFAQIVYLYFLQLTLNYLGIEKGGRANDYLHNGVFAILAHLLKVKTNYLLHYYYFGFSSKGIHVFGLVCIFVSIYGIYKDIKSKYLTRDKGLYQQTIIKWLVVILCVGANSFIFVIDPSGSLRTKAMQMILLLAVLLYSFNIILNFNTLFTNLAIKLNAPKNIIINTSSMFLIMIVMFLGYFNNLNGFVYMKTMETMFVKSEVLSQLTLKQNATQITIVQPRNKCYFGGCIGDDGFGISFTAASDWGPQHMTPAELRHIGIDISKFNITLISAENATPENIAKYNNNDTILIDTNALDKAFQLTYKK